MRYLKQSTSVDLPIGPFVDVDGAPTTGLTITQPDVRLKKNAAAWAQKNAAQTLTHEENGFYEVTLDATDTNTLGQLRLAVNESGALVVWEDFMVMPANVWDSMFGADLLQTDVREEVGVTIPAPITGTADSGSTTTVVDAARTEADTDYFKNSIIIFTSGDLTGVARRITAFTPASDTITFSPATPQAVSTHTYEIIPDAATDVILWNGSAVAVPTVAGVPEVDVTHLNGGATNGNNATLSLAALSIVNSGGTAVTVTASGGNGHGINVAGNGTGHGMNLTGGATARGLTVTGGATSGAGALITAGATAGIGLSITGVGANSGLQATSGAGATGDGIRATSVATNGNGINAVGNGTGVDVVADNLATAATVVAILAMLDDARTEPAQGSPPVNPDLATKIDYLYKAWRNRKTQTASELAIYGDDGVTKHHEAAVSDAAGTFEIAEMTTGA